MINGSIKENIRWGRNVNRKEIERVIELSGLKNLISNLKQGLDTTLGDSGALFSGGEKQRINLARALINKPKILLLDEPTSALDQKTASSIMSTIYNLRGFTTIFIVTHDLKNLHGCDNLINTENSGFKFHKSTQNLNKFFYGDQNVIKT